MADLVERYVHQVGHYVPPNERDEIEKELRSLIYDKLEDRYGESPAQEDVASVLLELGSPREMALSYGSDQYLIGPELYPYMRMVLRYGWYLVPSIVVVANGFGALASSEDTTIPSLVFGTIVGIVQAVLIFSAIVVLIFALLEHSDIEMDEIDDEEFNPLELPDIDDPAAVDYAELAFGMAFGTFFALVAIYFLRVGGLTLQFNLNDPGEVIPAPPIWMLMTVIVVVVQILLSIAALRRKRWNTGLFLARSVFELIGVLCLYFALFRPFFDHVTDETESLTDIPLFTSVPEIIAGVLAVGLMSNAGPKLIKLLRQSTASSQDFSMQSDA